MKNPIFILLLFASVLQMHARPDEAHKFYLSLSQVEYNSETKTLEVALKVFTHDLERCVGRQFRESLQLAEQNEHPKSDSLIVEYLKDKLQFYCNQEPQPYRWVGKEIIVDDTWLYFEIPFDCPSSEGLKITNRIFFEVFDEQLNMMKFNAPGMDEQRLDLIMSNDTGTFRLP